MQPLEIRQFLEDFFTETGCEILKGDASDLQVRLTIEIDKLLMNRHFYWHYLDVTGGEPKLSELHFSISDPSAEPIHFGTPRLHSIFELTKQLGAHTRQFEVCRNALFPWLCMNFIISFESNLQKSKFISLGLNMLNGLITEGFVDKISSLELSPKITDMSYTLHPAIMLQSGVKRIENYIADLVNNEDLSWIEEANSERQAAIKLLDEFYEDEYDEHYFQERNSIISQFTPKVVVQTINGGMFYLKDNKI